MGSHPENEFHLVGEIAARFQRNVDDIAKDFIAAYSLKFTQEVENLNSPLLRWLDFRFRYIDPQPRQVVFSDNFPKKALPEDANAGLQNLVRLIQSGADINPYQGRGLVLRNDTSSQRGESRTDLLWADWNIHHFHLSAAPIPEGQFFSHPADYLAFCIVGGDLVAFIDVLRHPDNLGFSNPDQIGNATEEVVTTHLFGEAVTDPHGQSPFRHCKCIDPYATHALT